MIRKPVHRQSRTNHENYSRRMHRSTILALCIVLTFSYFARFIDLGSTVFKTMNKEDFKALQVEIIKQIVKPPPKSTPILPPVRTVIETVPIPEKITTKVKAVPEKKRRTRKVEKVKFTLNDIKANLSDGSALDFTDNPSALNNRGSAFDDSPGINTNVANERLDVGPGDVNLELDSHRIDRQPSQEQVEFSLPQAQVQPKKPAAKVTEPEENDFLNADVSVVLASSDMNIGVQEYSLWNRLNAEFDRWDKGRYGSFPKYLQRKGRTITARFGYADGTAHHIIWNRGTTKIVIQGHSRRNRIDELKQAIDEQRALLSFPYLPAEADTQSA